ncbi:MAG: hypothetical protein ACRDRP_04525 [Pseudonocardiaceae bacterium]
MTAAGWGPWQLDLDRFELDRAPGSADSYPIDLLTCTDSAQVLDWICQYAGRSWGNDAALAGLVRALNDVLHPQATLCSEGKPTRLSDKQLRARITAAAQSNTRADQVTPTG